MVETRQDPDIPKGVGAPVGKPSWFSLGSPFLEVLPLLFLGCFVPLLVFLRILPLEGVRFDLWTGERESWDFFTYFKAISTVLGTAIGFVWIILTRRMRPFPFYAPVVVFGGFIAASGSLSRYPFHSWLGAVGRCEGVAVQLAYLGIFVLSANLVRSPDHGKLLLKGLFASSAIMGLIGCLQFLHQDPFRMEFVKSLICMGCAQGVSSQIVSGTSPGFVYATLQNPNYVGSYMSMIMVLAVTFLVANRSPRRFLLVPVLLLAAFSLIGSGSRTGLVAMVTGLLYLVILLRQKWQGMILPLGVLFFSILSVYWIVVPSWTEKTGNPFPLGIFDRFYRHDSSRTRFEFQDILLGTDSVTLSFSDYRINAVIRDGILFFEDELHCKISAVQSGNRFSFPPGVFPGMQVEAFPHRSVLRFQRESFQVFVIFAQEGFVLLDGRGRPWRPMGEPIRRWGSEALDQWGNGRGFMWSRCLPLLEQTLVLGFGPDMFALHFPQGDHLAKLRVGYPIGWFVDKPHNMYLHMALQTGILSLVPFFWILALFFHGTYNRCRESDFSTFPEMLSAGVSSGVVAYLVAGLGNDSTVNVAPVFWMLLGIGFSIRSWQADSDFPSSQEVVQLPGSPRPVEGKSQ